MEGNSETTWNTSNNFTYVFSILIKKNMDDVFWNNDAASVAPLSSLWTRVLKGFMLIY